MTPYQGILARYGDLMGLAELPVTVSLLEGDTPLIPARRLSEALGLDLDLYFKYDGANPTGSFKDRGMTAAVSRAASEGARALLCASTGNTSASAAAFGARSGLPCIVLLPEGKVAQGKLSQALVHGAHVLSVKGNFDQALDLVRQLPERFPLTIVNSINPDRILGQMSAAFEVVDTLGTAPEYHALPVGNAGNITATWRGYRRYLEAGKIRRLPIMLGFQAAGAAPLVLGHPVEDPQTLATAIRIGNPASWQGAVDAYEQSGGAIEAVTDEEILVAYDHLARLEGIFAEPASCASLAGVMKKASQGYFPGGVRVVCTLTGHGLKDPDRAIAQARPPAEVGAGLDEVSRVVEQLLA